MDELTGMSVSHSIGSNDLHRPKANSEQSETNPEQHIAQNANDDLIHHCDDAIIQAPNFSEQAAELTLRRHQTLVQAAISHSLKPSTRSHKEPVSFCPTLIKRVSAKFSGKQSIEIARVINSCQNNSKLFRWGWINPPQAGDWIHGTTLFVSGWLVGQTSQPISIKLIINETTITEVPVNIPRPDVTKAHFFEHVNCGFNLTINVEEVPNETDLQLIAVFSEGYTAIAGSIQIRKFGFRH